MKSVHRTYRIFALVMALLMFVTSVGYTVDMHFCQGNLKSVNFFGKAKSCTGKAAVAKMKNCLNQQQMTEQHTSCSMKRKNCCHNKTLHFQSDTDQVLQASGFVLHHPLQQFIVAYATVFLSPEVVEAQTSAFAQYKPPLISRDMPVLHQSFLL